MNKLIRKPYMILLLIALIGLLAYANTFSVPFQFDDDSYVVNNPVIRDFSAFPTPTEVIRGDTLSLAGIPTAFHAAFKSRILGYVSLAVNYKLHGLNVTGYHAFNLFLHILNTCLLFGIMRNIFRGVAYSRAGRENQTSCFLPFFASLFFLCHPIQTHAVTYITSRFLLLASFFSLLSLASYIRFRMNEIGNGLLFQVVSVLSAALGMMCKEFTFTLPFLIALYEFTFIRANMRQRFRALTPLALTLPIIPFLVFIKNGSFTSLDSTMRTVTVADSSQILRIDYLLTQFKVIVMYLRLLFFPVGQNIDHDISVQHSLMSLPVLTSFLLLMKLFVYSFYRLVRSIRNNQAIETRIIPFGIIWFFVALSVESSIIPMGELQAEYRLYLPSIGIFMAVTAFGAAISRRYAPDHKPFCIIATVLIITLCTATLLRNRVWQSNILLWQDAASKSPSKARPHYNLGTAYREHGDLMSAQKEWESTLAINPTDAETMIQLGTLAAIQGELQKAEKFYLDSLEAPPGATDPEKSMAHLNLGKIYEKWNQPQRALQQFELFIKSAPLPYLQYKPDAEQQIARLRQAT